MPDKLPALAPDNGYWQLPAGWRAVAMLHGEGIINPSERQIDELSAKLRAEDPHAPRAEALTAELLDAFTATFAKLRPLGVGHAVRAAEKFVWPFLDYLEHLHRAGGDVGEFARNRLLHLARAAVVRLEALTDEVPADFRDLAAAQESWPVMLNQSGENVTLAKGRCHKLKVGADCGLNVVPKPGRGKKPSLRSTPTNCEVRRLNDKIESACTAAFYGEVDAAACPWLNAARDLPAVFNGTTWPAWFKVGWTVLCHETGGRPETRTELWELGKTKVGHSARKGAQKVSTPATDAANVQSEIKKALIRAYKRVSG